MQEQNRASSVRFLPSCLPERQLSDTERDNAAHRSAAAAASVLVRGAATIVAIAVAYLPSPVRGQPAVTRVDSTRPNVVLVIADDLGLGDVAPFGEGRIRTPTFARIARDGVVFQRAYAAAPVCAPSRCAILTGLHAGHCSVRRNRQPNVALGLSDPTLADALGAAGYRTAFVGKWGLGGEASPGIAFSVWSAPWHVGFGSTAALLDDEAAVSPFPLGVWRDGVFAPIAENTSGAPAASLPGGAPGSRWIADVVVDDALAALDVLLAAPEPFLLVIASTLPHRELYVPDVGEYASEPWPAVERTYAAMVSRLDADVGRILGRLEEHGVLDSTLVLVLSDNGPNESDGHLVSFFDSTAGLRGHKRDLYEGGVRVPLLLLGAGVHAGTAIDAPVSLVDLLPTLCALTGAPAPDGLDGTSFDALLSAATELGGPAPESVGRTSPDSAVGGPDAGAPRAFFVGAAEANGGGEPPTRYALYEWPLVLVEREDGMSELYDLSTDPRERHDLASARPDDVERLRARRARESTGSIVRVDPVLSLAGGGIAREEPPARDAVVVLDLRLEAEGAWEPAAGGPAREPTNPESAPTAALRSRVDRPALRALAVGATLDDAGASFERARADHLVVATHPSLSFGDESFGVEARVALRTRATTLAATERQWLAVVKPTGTPDGAIDWGVLVQAADVGAAEADPGAQPGALAIVFGRGRLLEDDTWAVRSHLTIDDDEAHVVAVRFDSEHDRVVFELDGQREEVALEGDLGHVRSDGPLVIGAHHDAAGNFDGGLDGRIAAFRLVRGAGHAPSTVEPREVVIEVGSLIVGAADVVRHLTVTSDAIAPSRAMTLALVPVASVAGARDDRATATLSRTTVLGSTDRSVTLALTVTPSHAGDIDETWLLHGTALRLGHDAIGSPIRVRLRGRVGAPPGDPPLPIGWLEAGGLVAILAVLVWVGRARRRKVAAPLRAD